jgi:dipeptidyl aminopeptidase/acylaminoacyl peptidase
MARMMPASIRRRPAALLLLLPLWPALSAAQRPARPRSVPPSPAATVPPRAPGGVSLERLLAAPLPTSLVGTALPGAGGRGRIAWTSMERGARSVVVADLPAGSARRVAHFPGDDGQDVTDVLLSANGRTVVFVRGQGGNAEGDSPNPTSAADGAEQAVWASVDGQPARRLGAGSGAKPSPTGDRVAWVHRGQPWVAPAGGGAAPTPLFRARGTIGDLQWSPDGTRVAFTSARGTHTFVGVFAVGRREITWISPGVDHDRTPRWSADGRRLAFVRTPSGTLGGNVFAPTGGGGVALMVANPDAGEARVLWTSPAGAAGRLREPTAGAAVLVAGDRLLFFQEPDGWQHLYMLPLDGSVPSPVPLTRGACEVEEPSVTPDAAWVYVSANCGDLDRKHVWRVATDGSRPMEPVSTAPSPMAPSLDHTPAVAGGMLAYLRADAFLPAQVVTAPLPDGAGGAAAARVVAGAPAPPADFPRASDLVIPEGITLTASDGVVAQAQLFQPQRDTPNPLTGVAAGRRPAVVFVHGGPMRQMLLGWHPSAYYLRSYALNQYLASRGYVVLSLNFRLGIGYGRAFREAARGGRQGASELADVLAAARWLKGRADVDPARVGIWGGSYGGFLTALSLGREPGVFAAGVDIHGVHDWNERWSSFAPATVARGREPDSVLAVGRASSPVCCVASIRAPMLLIHGDDDRNVAFSETVTFVQLLRGAGVRHELLVFPDEVHGFLRHDRWLSALRATAEFFGRTIGRP